MAPVLSIRLLLHVRIRPQLVIEHETQCSECHLPTLAQINVDSKIVGNVYLYNRGMEGNNNNEDSGVYAKDIILSTANWFAARLVFCRIITTKLGRSHIRVRYSNFTSSRSKHYYL